MQEHRSKF